MVFSKGEIYYTFSYVSIRDIDETKNKKLFYFVRVYEYTESTVDRIHTYVVLIMSSTLSSTISNFKITENKKNYSRKIFLVVEIQRVIEILAW